MRSSKSLLSLALVLLLLIIASYSNHFHNDFHFDDAHTIVNNVYIRDIGNIPLFFKDAATSSALPQNQSYRPVMDATLALDYRLGGGLRPFYFHLSTFILFVLQGILMFLLFLRVFDLSWKQDINRLIAMLAVAWYLLHPANAETINYVIARSDSLSTLLIICALVAFTYSPVCRKWLLYLVPVALAILAKPVAAIFPVLFLAYLLLIGNDIDERAAWPAPALPAAADSSISSFIIHRSSFYARAAAPAFLSCALLLVFVGKMTPATWVSGGPAFFNYVITQPYVILHYFVTFLLPIHLSADTDWKPLASMADPRFIFGCLFIVSLLFTAFATARYRKLRPISFGILWFLIALFPTSIMPLAEVTNDHRMFFPFVGLAMSVTWALALGLTWALKVFRSEAVCRALVAILVAPGLLAFAWGTHQRNEVWRSEETLWRDVTIKSPRNGRGLMNYGLALMAKADYTGAEKYFMKGLEILPYYAYLHINLGILKEAAGRTAEAETYFRNALSFDAVNPECYYYYARFLRNQNRLQETLPVLHKALELAPAHLEAGHLLVEVHYLRSEYRKVIETANETLRIAPDDNPAQIYLKSAQSLLDAVPAEAASRTPEEYLDLSLRYYQAGLYEHCIEAAREALKLKPDYDLAYNNICSAYNMLGMWDKAIEAGEKAVELNPDNRLAQNNLAWARTHKADKP
ncbi:MAG: tetratricopeptide repeat protein [Syntrophobacteraceae bacterium]|jgi:tetratricopeptide (TPR) repeat protein